MTRKSCAFVWDGKCQEAFDVLKKKLTSVLVLIIPSQDRMFIVYMDVSLLGLGGVLM